MTPTAPATPSSVDTSASDARAPANAPSSFVSGGGGRSVTCIGLSTDVQPPVCSDPTFCHRLSLADLRIAVSSSTSEGTEAMVAHYESLDRMLGLSTPASALRACFGHEASASQAVRGKVRVELAGKGDGCPLETARVVERTASQTTSDCVRDTLKRWVLPRGSGKLRLMLEVSLSNP